MMLRRFVTSLRDQNWTSIAVEFVLLVIGVFLGIQVANWNETRHQRNQADALLERLEQDFAAMRERAVVQNRQYYDNTVKLDLLLTRAQDTDDQISDADAGQLLDEAMYFRVPQPAPISFQEMLAAGRLELVRNPALRTILREYADSARTIETASGLLANDYVVVLREMMPSITVIRAPNEFSSESVAAVATLNVAALRDDPKVRGLLTQMFLTHASMQSLTERQIASIGEVLAGIRASGPRTPAGAGS